MTFDDNTPWVDDEGPKLRPYLVTGGRTRPTHKLDLTSLVKAKHERPRLPLDAEHAQALALCAEGPRSVAEVAAKIRQPAQITKILLSDLLDAGALGFAVPAFTADPKDPRLLEAILAGLRER
jgi:hypothetical protein